MGSLTEQIGGLIPGIEYGQIQVSGDVNLAGTLRVTLIHDFRPRLNQEFLIIRKQSSGAILGEFSGLIEGSTVWVGIYGFVINYVGGTGNDVVLTATLLNTVPTAVAGGPYFVTESGSVILNGSGSSDPDPADTLTYEWDFDCDDEYDDATGVSPTFSAAGLDGPTSQTVR